MGDLATAVVVATAVAMTWALPAALLLLAQPALSKPTGLSGAALCCGNTCKKLHEESPRAWALWESLNQHAQILPRVSIPSACGSCQAITHSTCLHAELPVFNCRAHPPQQQGVASGGGRGHSMGSRSLAILDRRARTKKRLTDCSGGWECN